MRNPRPVISFTFDDFPSSALWTGGAILAENGAVGTYYASFGLMGQRAPTGLIFEPSDIPALLESGHELGCHTFAHCHAYDTPPGVFEDSVLRNGRELGALAPGYRFRTLSYPISGPSPANKRVCARYFAACRGGGQTHNAGSVDLSHVRAFFLEQSIDRPDRVREAIDANARVGGWLVFATHDVTAHPTRFGCEPAFFEDTVRCALRSGAQVLPMSEALEAIGAIPSVEAIETRSP
jgi:hypothetical protein